MNRKKRSHGCICVCGFEERFHENKKQNETETKNIFSCTFCVYFFNVLSQNLYYFSIKSTFS